MSAETIILIIVFLGIGFAMIYLSDFDKFRKK